MAKDTIDGRIANLSDYALRRAFERAAGGR